MPVFDQAEDRIVVHVVYDGPAFAGKTTNLEQLCTFFTEHRRSELFTTENAGERTVYLDWLQLEGGVVAGRKLRCQMITAASGPGPRRSRRHPPRLPVRGWNLVAENLLRALVRG